MYLSNSALGPFYNTTSSSVAENEESHRCGQYLDRSSLVDGFSPQKYKGKRNQMPVLALKWLENVPLRSIGMVLGLIQALKLM